MQGACNSLIAEHIEIIISSYKKYTSCSKPPTADCVHCVHCIPVLLPLQWLLMTDGGLDAAVITEVFSTALIGTIQVNNFISIKGGKGVCNFEAMK